MPTDPVPPPPAGWACTWFGFQFPDAQSFRPADRDQPLIEQVEYLWGLTVGSARLDEWLIDRWLLERGLAQIRAVHRPDCWNLDFLQFFIMNVRFIHEPLVSVIVKWGMRFIVNPALRQWFLLNAWDWHMSVYHAADWDQKKVIDWFKECRFDEPLSPVVRTAVKRGLLDDTMVLWRGGYGAAPDVIASGLSWTRDRAAAAFFATRLRRGSGAEPERGPVVIRREVRLDEVLMSNFVTPTEVIVAPSDTWAVDTAAHEWESMARGFQATYDLVVSMHVSAWRRSTTPAGALQLLLQALGKSHEDLERAIGWTVKRPTEADFTTEHPLAAGWKAGMGDGRDE